MLPRAAIVASPLNPRKHFDPATLDELAATMANGVGIIEPLVVRPGKKTGTFELVAGERRWRAAAKAGPGEGPGIVKALTDQQVVEQMLIENGQRDDLNALEEGDGYKQALKIGAFTDVEAIAAHVGKSRRHVYDTLKLVDDLVPEAKALMHDGVITASHGVILSRLTPAQQREAVNPDYLETGGVFRNTDGDMDDPTVGNMSAEAINEKRKKEPGFALKVVSVRDFEAWVNRHCRLELGDRRVREAFPALQAVVEQAAAVVHVTHLDYIDQELKRPQGEARIYTSAEWKRATGGKGRAICAARVIGVVVLGPGRGDTFEVCVDRACGVHWKQARQEAARTNHARGPAKVWAKSGRFVLKGRLEAENKRYDEEQRREAEARQVWKAAVPAIVKACAARMPSLTPVQLADLVLYWRGGGLSRVSVNEAARLLPKKQDAATVLQALALSALIDGCGNEFSAPSTFPAIAKRIGVSVAPPPQALPTSAAAAAKKKPAAPRAARKQVKKPAATAPVRAVARAKKPKAKAA